LPRWPVAATLGGVLSIRQLGKTYAGAQRRTVLSGVDLELGPGDYVAVMGESGIGKSTLLNLVAGLDRPDVGSIRLDGVDLAALDDDALTALRRVKMGFVFQAFHVLPYHRRAERRVAAVARGRPRCDGAGEGARDAGCGRSGRAQREHAAELSGANCSASRLPAL
jgi:ABC-type lipoprotein export system ATPase subunit